MVLTRRGYNNAMEVFCWLPNELLVHIIQHSSTGDQASLSRVSRLFHDLCLPALYRIFHIQHPDSVNLFCSAVIENPRRAVVVRSFTAETLRCARQDLLLAGLKLMSTLDHLSLSPATLGDRRRFILWKEHNFPQLISCDIWAPFSFFTTRQISDAVALFLAGHPTLKRFHIHTHVVPSPSNRVFLPNLECYGGDTAFIPAINTTNLKEAQFIWSSSDDADVEKIIIGVHSMTKLDVPFVFSHRFSSHPHYHTIFVEKIVTLVAQHMRHIKTLRFEVMHSQDTIRHITEYLPCFTSLVYLAMDWSRFYLPTTNEDVDRIAVEGWGKVCPTLEACSLNRNGWKNVDGRWEQCPIEEFWALAGLPKTRY
ncbi:hypothetical protein C8R45DRAFT_970304 [Mycena sanguinolenta]|nr:hypothetical protein C8R45DRAFT_970304 [Mycena sanguinolenta]